jgi:hypothetical protein
MLRSDLLDALDGFFAYYDGATDSGIKDERLKARVLRELHEMPAVELELLRLERRAGYSDAKGYAEEDREEFDAWFKEFFSGRG